MVLHACQRWHRCNDGHGQRKRNYRGSTHENCVCVCVCVCACVYVKRVMQVIHCTCIYIYIYIPSTYSTDYTHASFSLQGNKTA